MANDTSYYFDHDYNARNDDKIMELRAKFGAEGYGIFWMLVETMCSNDNGGVKTTLIGGLSVSYGLPIDRLKEIINTCLEVELFYEDAGYLLSKRVLSHKEWRKKLSAGGTKGAEKRWGGYSQPNANKVKEIKENKKGVSFSEDNEYVIFEDKSKRQLTLSEKIRLEQNDIQPYEIFK